MAEDALVLYPAWLYVSLVENTLPWPLSAEWTFEEFAAQYTLHDSYWVGIFHDVAYGDMATLAIVWDAVWLPDNIVRSTGVVAEWPFLFIRVNGVRQVSTSGYNDIGGLQRGIAGAEITEVEGKKLLVITDHYGGSVEVVFDGKTMFLGMDREKGVLPI